MTTQRLLDTEVLVVGGGFAGVAAAIAAAQGGRRTCLIERRTYLGAEVTATLRPWLLPELPVPDQLKTTLEDRLLAAGVTLLYAVRPVGVMHDGRYQVTVAGKFGQRLIAADRLIDATAAAELARHLGDASARGTGPVHAWRTLELTGVAYEALADGPPLPAAVAEACRFHPGYAAEHGHLLVEHALRLEPGPGAEMEARRATMRLARWLKEHHPAFAAMKVAAAAHELALPPLWRVISLPPGLWVASGCSGHLGDAKAAALASDPQALEQLGRAAGEEAASATQPAFAPAAYPWPRERRTVDVLVIGGGTSGVSASIGAARQGARTLLVELNPSLGGTGTVGGVDSYWFGRRGGFNAEISRRVAEQHAWMDWKGGRWNIEGKMTALLEMVQKAGVDLLLATVLVEVFTAPDGRVTGALVATPDGLVEIEARVTVDATGDGDAAALAGAEHVYGSDREGVTMWYSMIPYLRPGLTKNNFTSTVDVGDPLDYTRAILSARRRLPGHDHGSYVAPRESRHILGEVRVTLTDILTMRRWPDVINIHFSNHDVKGHNTSDWLRMGLIPPNLEVELPYRALVPVRVDGLLVTGKAFSATHDSLPPIRMQADLENLGFVTGTAAALCAARGITPRALPVRALQQVLVAEGLLPAELLDRTLPAPAPLTEAEMCHWIEALDDSVNLFEYGEMPMSEVRRDIVPMVAVCTAGEAILPLLREELDRAESPRRLHVARALAWYGDQAATPALLAEIQRRLDEAGAVVPKRTVHISYTQASPDHGAMPELCYLLHSLAMLRDERAIPVLMTVVERLEPTYDRFTEHHSGLFHYVDAVCDVAERLGHRGCLPALERLHSYQLFRGRMTATPLQADYFEERLAYLELTIGRAMARCGSEAGLRVLTDYLADSRRMLARHAERELRAIASHEPVA